MGFGSGAFQAARIAIDGITIIENLGSGKSGRISAGQQANLFYPVNFTPANDGTTWGYEEHAREELTNGTITLSAQASWSFPAIYGSIIDCLESTSTIGINEGASSTALNATSIAQTFTPGSNTQMIIVFVVADLFDGSPSEAPTITIADTAGNTWTERINVPIPGTATNVYMFYTQTTSTSSDTITVTSNKITQFYMQSIWAVSTAAISLLDGAVVGNANGNLTSSGLTGLTNISSSNTMLPIAFFGGTGLVTSATITPNAQNAYALSNIPLNINTLADGNILAYQSSSGTWINRVTLPATAGVDSIAGLTGTVTTSTPNSTMVLGTSGQNVTFDINLASANTWTAEQTFSGASTAVLLKGYASDAAVTVFQVQGGGNQIYTGLANIPTLSMQDSAGTTLWTIGSANGSGGSNNLTIWNQNTAYNFEIMNTAKSSLFAVNGTSNAASTLHNTLDDGSGNVTVAGNTTLPEDTSANGNVTGLFFEGGSGFTSALINNANFGSGQAFFQLMGSTELSASTTAYNITLYPDFIGTNTLSITGDTTTATGNFDLHTSGAGTIDAAGVLTITGNGSNVLITSSSEVKLYTIGSTQQYLTSTFSTKTTTMSDPYNGTVNITLTSGTGAEVQIATGSSGIPVKTYNNTLDDGTGNVTIAGYNKLNTAQTTLTGTSAGSIVWSQMEQGTAYKRFAGYLNGYENTTTTAQTITFPTAFSFPPAIQARSSGSTNSTLSFAATASTTTLTLPASMTAAVTGWLLAEGY